MLGPDFIPGVDGFELLALPKEVSAVFDSVIAVWDSLPLTVRMVLIFLYAMITFIVVLKMLT